MSAVSVDDHDVGEKLNSAQLLQSSSKLWTLVSDRLFHKLCCYLLEEQCSAAAFPTTCMCEN